MPNAGQQGPSAASSTAAIPIAHHSLAEDVQNETQDAARASEYDPIGSPLQPTQSHDHSLAGSYRRPSFLATGTTRSAFIPTLPLPESEYLSQQEQDLARGEERSLLRDNELIRSRKSRRGSTSSNISSAVNKTSSWLGNLRVKRSHSMDEEAVGSDQVDNANKPIEETTEDDPLLPEPDLPPEGAGDGAGLDQKWSEAVEDGKIQTTWQREAKTIGKYSQSLILTFILQYSLPLCSIVTVGHVGKIELGAVTLGSMSANITGYAVYIGLATSLDTLCAQAYGSGRKTLVGLQLQRMVYFLWVCTIPIAAIWLSGTQILAAIVPEKETARLAGLYLKIVLVGAPFYAAFEAGKRFVQAQGLFHVTLYVLLICSPLNILLHYLFVWHLGWGFIGAPIALTIAESCMPLILFLYVYFIDGSECWGGFSWAAFKNWGPMIRLALPGMVMLLAEMLAFEILSLSASWISPTHLAAQSVLMPVCAMVYQVPFATSIAASTRVANLIGATLLEPAKIASKVAMTISAIIGCIDLILLASLRWYIPRIFTSDEEVIMMVAHTLPVCAAFQLFDSLAAFLNGILRGLGRQEIGGYVALIAYYGVAVPVSFGTGFGLKWHLLGLWAGPATALLIITIVETIFILNSDWQKAVDWAQKRNANG